MTVPFYNPRSREYKSFGITGEENDTLRRYVGSYGPSDYTNEVVDGIGALVMEDAVGLNHIKAFGNTEQNGTPTKDNPVDIVCNNGTLTWDGEKIVAVGTQEKIIVTDSSDQEQYAVVEMLNKVGDYEDSQNITTGKVVRKCGVCKYDGTQKINEPYISTTGGLDEGAIIVYPLDTPEKEIVTAQEISIEGPQTYTVDKYESLYDLRLEVSYKQALSNT